MIKNLNEKTYTSILWRIGSIILLVIGVLLTIISITHAQTGEKWNRPIGTNAASITINCPDCVSNNTGNYNLGINRLFGDFNNNGIEISDPSYNGEFISYATYLFPDAILMNVISNLSDQYNEPYLDACSYGGSGIVCGSTVVNGIDYFVLRRDGFKIPVKNCPGKLYTDSDGQVICGNDNVGGGSTFDQSLNTNDSVNFSTIITNNSIISNDYIGVGGLGARNAYWEDYYDNTSSDLDILAFANLGKNRAMLNLEYYENTDYSGINNFVDSSAFNNIASSYVYYRDSNNNIDNGILLESTKDTSKIMLKTADSIFFTISNDTFTYKDGNVCTNTNGLCLGGYNSLSALQGAVSNDFHNLGGVDAIGGNSTQDIITAVNNTALNGSQFTSIDYNNLVNKPAIPRQYTDDMARSAINNTAGYNLNVTSLYAIDSNGKTGSIEIGNKSIEGTGYLGIAGDRAQFGYDGDGYILTLADKAILFKANGASIPQLAIQKTSGLIQANININVSKNITIGTGGFLEFSNVTKENTLKISSPNPGQFLIQNNGTGAGSSNWLLFDIGETWRYGTTISTGGAGGGNIKIKNPHGSIRYKYVLWGY